MLAELHAGGETPAIAAASFGQQTLAQELKCSSLQVDEQATQQ
jgi:hypothetical protein